MQTRCSVSEADKRRRLHRSACKVVVFARRGKEIKEVASPVLGAVDDSLGCFVEVKEGRDGLGCAVAFGLCRDGVNEVVQCNSAEVFFDAVGPH
jgi:hypothetical protein